MKKIYKIKMNKCTHMRVHIPACTHPHIDTWTYSHAHTHTCTNNKQQ